MDSSFYLAILAAAICFFFMILRKFRFPQQNKEIASSSFLSPSSSVVPSSLSPSSSIVPYSLSPSSSVVPSSSSSHNRTHQVFPSFRGEDVRRGFLSHILKEFQRKGITPFIDNGIKRGESIGPELIQAIRGSKIAVILLSRNYASSKWCLGELVEIMKCREDLGQTVMAIFYKVDPCDVKKLTGDFGKGFRKTCAGKSKEDIKRWREALGKVATIAGYHSINWDNEADMIETITINVSNVLINSTPSSDFDDLVGMEAHMEEIAPLLRLDSDEVRMIGIWGPSGIGKSTIARVLFTKYSSKFQLSVFMANIKRRYPRPCHDEYSAKLQLQNEFLSQLINHEGIKIHHLGVVEDMLKDKRVLVVLDDVDHLAQLEAVAKKITWFGLGSRIIITTQDKRLLNAHGTNRIYEVGFPRDDEAFRIFCTYAFGQKSPYDGFMELAWEVTKLSGKLPLGLRVMGSHFKGKSKHEWEKELPRLKANLDGEIESILEFSYKALHNDDDKDLFLYIACFFSYEEIDKIESHLSERFFDVRQGLHVLAEKSLIFISIESEYIYMHDLLARLGRALVRRQSTHDIAQRQFLVDARDICQVLSNYTIVSRSVLGINSDCSEIEDDIVKSDRAFEKMYNLKFLKIWISRDLTELSRSYLQQNPNLLPGKLKLLHWEFFPMKCLPSNFNPKFLVEIWMQRSKLENLWEGNQTIRNLKWMDLRYSENLKELPDLSTATNLKQLILIECLNLVELPSSIGNAVNLKKLYLTGCSNLVELPSSIGNAVNLKKLYLCRCSNLVELPSSIGNNTNLVELDLRYCSSLVELPSSIGNLQRLPRLRLRGCSKLKALPTNINMESLDELDLTGCFSLKRFPEISTNIRVLNLFGTTVEEVPSSIRSWSRLETLEMSYHENLKQSPHAFDFITELWLSDTGIQEIGAWVKRLSHLRKFVIRGCTKLVSLPQLPESLAFLDAQNCESLGRLDCSFHNTEFEELNFANCFKLNQEARDLIMTSTCKATLLPGDEVPTYFTHRVNGSSLSMTLNGVDTHLPGSVRFKACVLLVYKGDAEVGDHRGYSFLVDCCIEDKQNGTSVKYGREIWHYCETPLLNEHLYIFDGEEEVSSSELLFEFTVKGVNKEIREWEIRECGLNYEIEEWET